MTSNVDLADDVKAELKAGCYQIKRPRLLYRRLKVGDGTVAGYELKCRSLKVLKPNIVVKCKGTIKTYVGAGSGTQTEIVSCHYCHTCYAICTSYEEGNTQPTVTAELYYPSRGLESVGQIECDAKGNTWVAFQQ